MELFSNAETLKDFKNRYEKGVIKYEEMKEVLAEDIIRILQPIKEKRTETLNKSEKIKTILEKGSQKAQKIAQTTLHEVKQAIGFSF